MALNLALVAFVLLVFQNTVLVLSIRYSKLDDKTTYITSTAISMGELTKVGLCCIKIVHDHWSAGDKKTTGQLLASPFSDSFQNITDSLKMAVPAGLFAFQNNLLFFALANLQASVYQVLYQLKILTTAMFLVSMLGKNISRRKWMMLFFLFIGVVLTQIKETPDNAHENSFVGLFAVLGACCTSGFAGVYMEKVVKQTAVSLWIRNVQLGTFGFFLSLVIIAINDGAKVAEHGFFHNYTSFTCFVILLHGVGGILVACVIKYADNLVKTIASSISIVISAFVSWLFLDFNVTFRFAMGAAIVVSSAYLYSLPDPAPKAGSSNSEKEENV